MLKDHIMEEMKIILEQPHPTIVGWGVLLLLDKIFENLFSF